MDPIDGPGAVSTKSVQSVRDTATLFLDRELRIIRFSPKVGEFFNIRMTDRGRPVSDLARRLGYDALQEDAAQVLQRKIPIEREVQDEEGRWFLTRVLPFRRSGDGIEGIALSFVDITWHKQSEVLGRELASRLAMAEQAERRRISRILHDDLQQLLYGVGIRLEMIARRLCDPDQSAIRGEVAQARQWVDEALSITCKLAVDLSPPVLPKEGLVESLRWLQGVMKELHGLDFVVESEQPFCPPDRDLSQLLFQSTRELLFNVKKHSGVDRAKVRLTEEAGSLSVHVIDEGGGFDLEEIAMRDHEGGSSGLFSLRERLDLVGGRLDIRSRPGCGTHIEMQVPITPA
jgi:two-component system, chemotaxis family, CheB/CheR fusion protein